MIEPKPLTRSVSCPDGVSRLITMDARFWRNLQWLETMGFVAEGEIAAKAWNAMAPYKDNDLREVEFTSTLAHMIYQQVIALFPSAPRHKNDNKTITPDAKKLFSKINKGGSAKDFSFPVGVPMTTSVANFNERPDFQVRETMPRIRPSNENISA